MKHEKAPIPFTETVPHNSILVEVSSVLGHAAQLVVSAKCVGRYKDETAARNEAKGEE